jgi:hypothetical protein
MSSELFFYNFYYYSPQNLPHRVAALEFVYEDALSTLSDKLWEVEKHLLDKSPHAPDRKQVRPQVHRVPPFVPGSGRDPGSIE